jgi:glucose/arabinose dehydrogenase
MSFTALVSRPSVRRSTVGVASLIAVGGLLPAAAAPAAPRSATSAVSSRATTASTLPSSHPVAAATARPAVVVSAQRRLSVTRVAGGLSNPVLVRSANDGTNRLFVVEQAGRVRTVVNGRITGTFLDIRSIVDSGGERGLLGLAFAPDFARSHLLWVTFTRSDGALVVARYAVAKATSPSVIPNSRRTVLVVPHPNAANHNGGDIAFGRDGYLYLGTGDGGSAGDPPNNAQNLRSLSGKMLRINVRCRGHIYCIPPTNPYVRSPRYRHEIWMLGLRNPWRWSFDTNGTIWIGDVGQNAYEEIDAVPASRQRAANMGWSCREAGHPYRSDRCSSRLRYTPPTLEVCHPDLSSGCNPRLGAEALIGGYVYRGRAKPSAVGTYVFGDYVTGRVWAFRGATVSAPSSLPGVAGFGTDRRGEIYAVTLDGGLYRIGFIGS